MYNLSRNGCLQHGDPAWDRKVAKAMFSGKSSLTVRFVDGHFVESYYPTIENTFSCVIKYKNQEYATEIVDTAGQVRVPLASCDLSIFLSSSPDVTWPMSRAIAMSVDAGHIWPLHLIPFLAARGSNWLTVLVIPRAG